MKGTWFKVVVCSSLVILGILIGYVTHVFFQEDISESNQDQVNTFQDEVGPNQRQPSFIKGGNSGFGTTKEYNEGEVESKDPGSN
ncbi:hypothetical protein COI41_30780 [Bacillus toyonensis]|uniref:hypothetical protein n=1 Tax=Bacillus toyonensis TaxID=155322 RepID=UPI000BF0FFBA|nr:hypothetical protein [Bacillus toyonensis]PEO56792.1 hypothetical protein CN567_28895 [Bacillus toyonensis]PFX78088.1 hypothetical protein COL38_23965 [Bacillus toyonensis]PFX85684.1 hypothetical protein COL37_18910 [Bacillus toyonensis]PGB12860.1 hypothetical protein COL98_20180 [Bacillus toyonensis]PHD41500.1 hypothetical protein COF67_30555 [Bacillus toyonensis]